MKVAVIYTGALRTVEKTIKYLKKNLILNDNVHIFACLENDSNKPTEEWMKWFHEQLGDNLKDIAFGSIRHDGTFINLRERILSFLNISDNWKAYLRNSGSMIEHYQIWLTNQIMCNYEQKNNFRYDYVIRCRTDTIFGKPIDFSWLNYTEENINERLTKIKNILIQNKINYDCNQLLYYFMTTIINEDLIENIQNIDISNTYNELKNINDSSAFIKNYIDTGRYILTIRENLLYIVKRDYFSLIPSIGLLFGTLRYAKEDPIWYNSEGQFKAACYNSQLMIFDYTTSFENKSLYEFDRSLYFDEDYNLKVNNLLYCIVRN
jgi:hypothetical protein